MTASAVARAAPHRRFGLSRLAWREARWAYVFLAPWIIGFLAFTLIPMIATFIFTLTNINLNQAEPLRFVGLDNYARLLGDQQTWESFTVTLKFAAVALPVAVILPFMVALLLSSRYLRFAGAFRVLFFLPYVVPFVAGVLIWLSMLNGDSGWLNLFLQAIGVSNPPNWLQDPNFVYAGLVLVGIWGIGGGVIVYLAGLKGVPTELYDAARIDGAGWWARFAKVIVPIIAPILFIALLFDLIFTLSELTVVYLLTSGGPVDQTQVLANLSLQVGVQGSQLGQGAAIALYLLPVLLLLTFLALRTIGKREGL